MSQGTQQGSDIGRSSEEDRGLATPRQISARNSQEDCDVITQKQSDNGVGSQDSSHSATPKPSGSGQNREFATPRQNKSGQNSQSDPSQGTPKRSSGRSSQIDPSSSSLKAANDDDAERHSRQQEILQQLTADNLESPGTPSSRRMSMGIAPVTLTDVQLAEHYASCIRLANENKITTKNAFQLHLIDHLRKVLIAKDGTTNFITAGCTLDASAKIYAHRVDYIHAEVFHIAGELGLGSRFRKRIMKGRAAADDNADPDNPQVPAKGAQKKPRRRANTLVRNEKTISVQKVDAGKPVDPLEEYIRANSTYGTSDCFVLNHINTFSDRGELVYLNIKRKHEPLKQTFTDSPVDFFRLLGGVRKHSATCPDCALAYMWCDDSMEEERYGGYNASESFFQLNATASIAATEEPMAAMPSVCVASTVDCDGAAPADGNASIEEVEEEGPEDILKNGISELAKYIAPEKREYSYFVDNAPAPNAAEYWRARLAEKARKTAKVPERKHKKAAKIVPLIDFAVLKPNSGDFVRLKRPPVLDKSTYASWKDDNNVEPFLEDREDVNLTNLILITDIKITLYAEKPVRLGNFGKRLQDQDNNDFCPDVNEESNMYDDNADDAPADDPVDAPADAPPDAPPDVPAAVSVDAPVDAPAVKPAVEPAVNTAVALGVLPPFLGPAAMRGLPDRFLKPLAPPSLKPIYDALGFKYPVKAPAPAPRFQPSYKRVDMKDMKKAIWQTLSSGRTLVSGKGNEGNKATKVDKGNTKEVDKDSSQAHGPCSSPVSHNSSQAVPGVTEEKEPARPFLENGSRAMNKPEGLGAANNPEEPCAESKPGFSGVEKQPEEAAPPGIHSFQRVYRHLKPHLNRLNRENVSVPVAFVALLHLANEKGFYVHNKGDNLADLDIELPE